MEFCWRSAFALADDAADEQSPFSARCIKSAAVNQHEWRVLMEPLIVFDSICGRIPRVCCADGLGDALAYHSVFRSGEERRSDRSGTAQVALEMARKGSFEAASDPREQLRRSTSAITCLAKDFCR